MWPAAKVQKYTFSDEESEKFNSDDDFPIEPKAGGAAPAKPRGNAAVATDDDDSSFGLSDEEGGNKAAPKKK